MDRAIRIATLIVLIAIAVLLAFILSAILSVFQTATYSYDGTPIQGVRVLEFHR
ncbi:MAG: hypothetical protein HEQ23_04645 [Tepidisphaera sp.]